jgi:MSHA biogenesis protein MshN
MSLVNKMLRDLDARRVSDGDRAALPAAVTSLAAHQDSGGGLSRLWVGAILLAAVLGLAAWYATRLSEVPVALPAATASSARALPAAPVVTGVAEPAAVIAPAALPEAKVALPTLRMADQLSASPATPVAPQPKPPAAAPKATKTLEPPQVATVAPPSVQGVQSVLAAAVPKPAPAPVPGEARIDKQVSLPSPAERAEIEYRRGILAQRQGNPDEAVARYRAALEDYPEHAAARQTLAAFLIDAKQYDEAEDLLRKGMALAPVRLASTLALARLKVERNQAPAALDLLLKNAEAGERSAEYQGFAGALFNRAGRAPEAVDHYRAATRLAPNEGRWWAGLGIALEAAGKGSDAREACQKARTLPGLPADLAQHIEQRMR